MSTFGLLRTNPKMTGNVKISVNIKGEMYLNSIDANKELGDDDFKRKKIDPNSNYSKDVYRFFDNGRTPSNLVYDVWRTTDDLSSKTDFSRHYENQYNYGTERCDSDFFDEDYCIFAPIWLNRSIPNFFVVFKNPGARSIEYDRNPELLEVGRQYVLVGDADFEVTYNSNTYISGQSFTTTADGGINYTIENGNGYVILMDPDYEHKQATSPENILKNFVSPSDIVQVFDMREGTALGDYLRRHINDPLYKTNSINIDLNNNDIFYNGIDLSTGVLSEVVEDLSDTHESELSMIDYDESITGGFERNRILSANMLNMEFMFNDKKSENYTFNRYFGFYCDDLDIGEFFIDREKTIGKSGYYPNPFYDKDVLPTYYGKVARDEDGIKVVPEEVVDVEGYLFDEDDVKDNPTFFYLKDKRQGFHKLNNKEIDGNEYVLMDKSVDTELLFGFNDSRFELNAQRLDDAGRSSLVIDVNSEVETGYEIQIFKGKHYLGSVFGDHLPDIETEHLEEIKEDYSGDPSTPYQPGESIGYYFYPTGTIEQVTTAMASAIDWLLHKEGADTIANGNRIFVRFRQSGSEKNTHRMVIVRDQGEITLSDTKFSGGTDTAISRVRIDADFPEEITENSFIFTSDGGFAKVQDISPYLEEPVFGQDGDIVDFNNIAVYKVISIVDPDKQISLSSGKISVYNNQKLTIGVFSLYDLKDMDVDFYSSSYNKAYEHEYLRYYKVPKDKLIIGEYYQVHKVEGTADNPVIEHAGEERTISKYPIISVDELSGKVMIDGNHISEFNGQIAVRIRKSDGNDGFYQVSSVQLIGGDTEIDFVSPTLPDSTVNGEVNILFEATSEEYSIKNGNPVIIADKYYDDDELRAFIGFTTLNTGEDDIEGLESSDMRNKYAILSFDETRTEYNRLKENLIQSNVTKSRVVPYINKWVMEDGNNIRDVKYRLNASRSFGQMNFTPSFVDDDQNPIYYTHEWLYLSSIPNNISDEDLTTSTGYFDGKFDIEELKSTIKDYFTEYFTIDEYLIEDSPDNRLLEVPTQERFSTVKRLSQGNFETFFRGVRVKFFSDTIDYSGYKFSTILNIHKTSQFTQSSPFDVTVVENRDYRNVTIVVDITVDDYKALPDENGKIRADYLYLYLANSLKRWEDNQRKIGLKFDYPDLSPVDLYNSGVFGNPLGDPNAAPQGSPITTFRGYQIFQKLNMDNAPNVDALKFDDSKFLLTDFYGVGNEGNFNRLIGMNSDGVLMITSTDPFHSPSEYVVDRPSTVIGLPTNNVVQLKSSGLSIFNIPGLSVVDSFTPDSIHNSIYPMEGLTWFSENGGSNVYESVMGLLSFAGLSSIINENIEKHISYKLVEGGNIGDNQDLSIRLLEPSRIEQQSTLRLEESNSQLEQIPEENVKVYNGVQTNSPQVYFRYAGKYVPKFKDVLKFKNDKLQMAWGLNDTAWEDTTYTWEEFDVQNPKDDAIPFSRRLFGHNTKFDTSINDLGVIENLAHHKVSSTDPDLMDTENPVYPTIGEVAIDRKNHSIFLSDLDAKYFKDYLNKDTFSLGHGSLSIVDEKSFLGSKILQVEDDIKLTQFNNVDSREGIDDIEFDIGDLDIAYEVRESSTLFRISVRSLMIKYFTERISEELRKYVSIPNTLYESFDDVIRDYVIENLESLYGISEVSIFVKRHNQQQIPIVVSEDNTLELFNQGYVPDRNISTTILDNLEVISKYTTDSEFNYSFSIRVGISKQNI